MPTIVCGNDLNIFNSEFVKMAKDSWMKNLLSLNKVIFSKIFSDTNKTVESKDECSTPVSIIIKHCNCVVHNGFPMLLVKLVAILTTLNTQCCILY